MPDGTKGNLIKRKFIDSMLLINMFVPFGTDEPFGASMHTALHK